MKSVLIATGIFPPDIGGPASYAATTAKLLHEKGIRVGVLSYSSVFNTKEFDAKHPYPVIRVWGGWPIWIKHFIFGIKLLVALRSYDTVFALNVWSAGFPARIASRLLKKKFIVRIAGDYAWEIAVGKGATNLMLNDFQKAPKKGWVGMLYRLQGVICKGAHMVIVPSEYLGEVVQGWGIPQDKIKVVYNGTDFKASALSKEEARKKLGLNGNVILSAGRLVPWKGFRMLIKIVPKLSAVNQFFQLVIVGDGPDRKNLESIVRNMGLERKVRLVGRKSQVELAEYIAAADMFVLNTGYEGFSHQVLEAMSAGVPLITTSAGGNKEIIHQGQNGFMVKYNDEFNLIEVIRTLWNSPDIRERFIEEGKKTASYFTVEKMFHETVTLLSHE
jgi:glycosyltransferase involved in cell wall biosynthesis